MPRVLIVAYYFPPVGGIGSIRAARFATYLPASGWEPWVLAPRRTPHASDPKLPVAEERVVRSHSVELSQIGRAVLRTPRRHDAGGRATSAAPPAARRAAHRYLFFPDAQIGWFPGALAAGRRTLKRRPFDAVFSSSNPITAHLIGRSLAHRAGIPWIAEFRDPWSHRLPPDHPYRRQARRLEDKLGREAAAAIAPTPTWANFWSERWGRAVTIIPNGHDIGEFRTEKPDQLTITHLGSYYPGRQDFRSLWDALVELRREGSRPPKLRLVGDIPAELTAELSDRGLHDLTEVTGFLPHEEAMQAVASSSILLAGGFGGSDPISLGVIPAKLFEYLATPLPILYLGQHVDDAAQLLATQPGCFIVHPGDVEGVRHALDAARSTGAYERDAESLSRRARTRALAAVLDGVASRP